MTIALSVAAAAALLACYFSAAHAVLKTFSRKRLSDLLSDLGRADELPRVVDHLPALILMTGVVRSALNVIVVLAVFWAVLAWGGPGWTAGWVHWVGVFVVSLAVQGVFTVAIPVSWARYHGERLLLGSMPLLHAMRIALVPLTRPLHVLDPLVRRLSGVDLRDDDEDLSDGVERVVANAAAGAEGLGWRGGTW